MLVHLKNDENRTELNLDFTKFFSTDVQIIRDEKGKIVGKYKPEHKKLMKALVETFIYYDYRSYIRPETEVDALFDKANKELENDKARQGILFKNWMMFKEMYHMKDKQDPFISKMNKFRDNNHAVRRFKSGDCSFLTNGIFSVTYEKTEGLLEIKTDEFARNKFVDMYESTVENADYILNASYKSLKLLTDGFDIDFKKHLVQVRDEVYEVKQILTFLNTKESVEVWQDGQKLLLRQSDRDIILISRRKYNNCEINRLENVV